MSVFDPSADFFLQVYIRHRSAKVIGNPLD
jgi:hypothetical protein